MPLCALQIAGSQPTMGRFSVQGVSLALTCAAFTLLTGIGLPTAAAQTDVSSTGSVQNTTARDSTPSSAIFPGGLLDVDETYEPVHMLSGTPAFGPETPPARIARGPLDVIRESIFGEATAEEWQPLGLSNFFTEGWDKPFATSPEGTNGAPSRTGSGPPTASSPGWSRSVSSTQTG